MCCFQGKQSQETVTAVPGQQLALLENPLLEIPLLEIPLLGIPLLGIPQLEIPLEK